MDCCSGDELLTQLLEDQLDHTLAVSITAHVEACVTCQERLRQLTVESTHYMKWGYFGNEPDTPWGTPVHLMEALGQKTPTGFVRTMSDFAEPIPKARFPPSKATSS